METANPKSRIARGPTSPEDLLESYYSQFLKWGSLLTRGDRGMAHDIVHDLCLHFTLAQPDLSQVENLDGYLYTCLRHIYLSMLDRSSREATHLVSIAEFDSIYFAFRSSSPEGLLQRQNDLRRICNYEIWRKDSAKSASYLTLLFFHGYTRREIADIACAPLAAIYNKLKIARTELKGHLEEANQLSIARRDIPPAPELRHSVVPFAELFDELRARILSANTSDCVPEDNLLAHYRSRDPRPISCSLLSHIVSCERCLTFLDRHFRRPSLADREPPVVAGDPVDRKPHGGSSERSDGYSALMRSIRWHRERIYEHRPKTLSIAVNGRITAFHDVQGERSTLCSRIEHPERAQFVEVFTEQRVRLALLPVGVPPPDGLHSQTQRVPLSDERWLQLTLSFDGLGLNSEVIYIDPALAAATFDEDLEDYPLTTTTREDAPTPPPFTTVGNPSLLAQILRFIQSVLRPPALAWSAILAVALAIGGYLSYERVGWPSNPHELLSQSMKIESAELNGQAEHQILRVEETAPDGHLLLQGTVDVWKESNGGRHMRRLYDAQKRLIAAEWQTSDGRSGSYSAPDSRNLPNQEHEFAAGSLWRQDVSANAFRAMGVHELSMRKVAGNYEITVAAPNEESHLVSATLVLDGRLHAVGEILRIQTGSRQSLVRFVQADYERRPASSVPDSVFDAADLETHSRLEPFVNGYTGRLGTTRVLDSNVRLVQLHIAVLAELKRLGADVGEPIEVKRTPDGHVRISGAVADGTRRSEIAAALEQLPDRELLEMRVISQSEIGSAAKSSRPLTTEPINVYNIVNTQALADPLVRGYFSSKGWNIDRVNSSAAQFSRDALGHAQRALQEAYALDRLGNDFNARELQAIDDTFRHRWAEMSASHAFVLQRELRALHEQLAQISPSDARNSELDHIAKQIQNPGDFARSVHVLLRQVQRVNESVGVAFTSSSVGSQNQNAIALLNDTVQSIPLRDADEVATFTTLLAAGEDGKTRSQFADKKTPGQEPPK
jgi:DNA-directed RNA polymerase specialized sigma24 family protein